MAACKSDKINNVKQAIQLAGKQPVIIDVDAFALQNCYEVNYQPRHGEIVALLNIGAATMNINVLNGARSIFARDASVGGSQYTSLLQELGISFEQAESVKRGLSMPEGVEPKPIQPIIEAVSETLALEVKKTLTSIARPHRKVKPRFRRFCSRVVDRSCLACLTLARTL